MVHLRDHRFVEVDHDVESVAQHGLDADLVVDRHERQARMPVQVLAVRDQHDLELRVEVKERLEQRHHADDLVALPVGDVLDDQDGDAPLPSVSAIDPCSGNRPRIAEAARCRASGGRLTPREIVEQILQVRMVAEVWSTRSRSGADTALRSAKITGSMTVRSRRYGDAPGAHARRPRPALRGRVS